MGSMRYETHETHLRLCEVMTRLCNIGRNIPKSHWKETELRQVVSETN